MCVLTNNNAASDRSNAVVGIACLSSLLAVLIGAFAGHGLAEHLQAMGRVDTFDIANRYHFYHSLALFGIGLWIKIDRGQNTLSVAAVIMVIGLLLFCGSLYGLALSGKTWLAMITPLGGLCFIVAWLICIVSCWMSRQSKVA